MMNNLLAVMRMQSLLAGNGRAVTRSGIVDSYDPGAYAARVRIQPEDVITGWLPILSPWVGNSWGLFAPPTIGDLVEVCYSEDDTDVGYLAQRFFSDADRPLPCPSGEFWLVHKSGSMLKFLNNGDVQVTTQRDLLATVGRDLAATTGRDLKAQVTRNIVTSAAQWNHSGPVNITGDVGVTGTVTASTDVIGGGKSLKTHTHGGVLTGGGTTGPPS